MTDVLEPTDTNEAAEQIALIGVLLSSSTPNQPIWRWLEYQAYSGFVKQAADRYQIPDSFDLYIPDAKSVQDWIAGRKELQKKLADELVRLLRAMKAAGSSLVDELCEFYCAYKKKLALGGDAASLVMNVAAIKAILTAYAGDMLYVGGVPITAFAALLLHMGLLDSICECSA
jgi:hypothetical protein